ncbi:MAG: glycosyltransferase family 39 protein [Pseudomonadota bacterium]
MAETATHIAKHANRDQTVWWARLWVMTAFVLVLTAIKLVLGASTDLIRDEAYYGLWAQWPLQAGYYDHPPALVWFIKLGQAIVGDSELGLRLLATLSTVPVSAAIWRLSILAFECRRTGATAVYWFNVTIGGLLGLLVITPDAPSMVFWALTLWAAAELARSGKGQWWLAVGVFAGLGLSAKYTGFFLGAGLVLWMLIHADMRRWLWSAWTWAGGALALAIFAPVVIWNLGNDGSSFAFQMGRAVRGAFSPSDLVHIPEFLAGQMGLMLPWLFFGCLWFLVAYARRQFGSVRAEASLLVWTAVPTIAYFLIHALHSRIEGNWPWPLYPQLAVLGAYMAAGHVAAGRIVSALQKQGRVMQPLLGILIAVLIFVQATTQIIPSGTVDRTREMHGWGDVARNVDMALKENGAVQVYAIDYGLLGWLSVYGAWENVNSRAYPAGEQWRYGFKDPPISVTRTVIVAARVSFEDARALEASDAGEDLIEAFGDTLEPIAFVPRENADGSITDGVALFFADAVQPLTQ